MKTNSCLSLICLIFFCFTQPSAQEGKLIPAKKLKKDLKMMTGMIEAHPAPYRHITEKKLNELIDSTRKLLNEPMNQIEFYKLASPIIATIKDGHSSLSFRGQWLKNYRKDKGIFPYKVYLTEENKLYIIDNYSDDKTIALGEEILSLNGTSTSDFLKSISRYISYEQEIFRNSIIQSRFDFYLLLHFGEITEVNVGYSASKPQNHTVKYIDYGDWKEEIDDIESVREKSIAMNKPYDYESLGNGVGIIKIYSFAISSQSSYEVFLRKTFKKINQDSISSLVIDVRGNTGGFPRVVSDLIHHISDKYFKTMALTEMKVSNTYKSYYTDRYNINSFQAAAYNGGKRRHYIDLRSILQKEVGTIVKEADFFNEPPEKKVNEFKGDLYMLIDKRSYSASSSFAATFRCYQLGLLIGEETGGTKVFHANSIYKKMQHSGIYCGMATTRDYTACFLEEDEGIKPDLEAIPTIPQLVAKQDVALNYTLRVIKKVKKVRAAEKAKIKE